MSRMTTRDLLFALRNAAEVARYCEAAPVEDPICPNALVIRAVNLCAMGNTVTHALVEAWRTGLPVDTPASQVLETAYDNVALQTLELQFMGTCIANIDDPDFNTEI